jgi:hypothetical protein
MPGRTSGVGVRSIALVMTCLSGGVLPGGPENLDEMRARTARHATATWSSQLCEKPADDFKWQPETLAYRDVQTGSEVWRMTCTPSKVSFFHNDISITPWSADGKRMAFVSDRDTGAFNRNGDRVWFVVDTSGTNLRPVIGGPSRTYHHTLYFHWSPQIPDVYYEFGRNAGGVTGLRETDLYKATVSDTGVTKSLLLSFPATQGTQLMMEKSISADGRKIIAMPWDEHWLFPATIYPDSAAKLDLANGYTVDRNMATGWGDTPASYVSLHDHYYPADGAWHYILPEGNHSWWRVKVLGSALDGGALYLQVLTTVFGEEWPENTVSNWGGNPDPFGAKYWSHFTPDRWGRFALQSNGDLSPIGPSTWDIQKHKYSVPTYGGGAQHHDWSGFTDSIVSSRGDSTDTSYLNDRIYLARYNDAASQQPVAFTHTLFNSAGVWAGASSQYYALARPAQSPDGTKVAYHGTFLNSTDYSSDFFWAVAYYPAPAQNLSAHYDGGVTVQWLPPQYTQRGWPYASPGSARDSLGWPLLDQNGREIGEPIYARELKTYHVWRSPSGVDRWQEVGSVEAQYSAQYAEDQNMFMLHPIVNGRKVSSSNKVSFNDQPGSGTFYYAVTCQEHSGLESQVLSEVLRVTVSGGAITDATVVQQKGQKDFWRVTPPAPTPSTFRIAAGTAYQMSWTEPRNSHLRYYNVYYSALGAAQPVQAQRIASVPVGSTGYTDWCPDKSGPGYYLVTSVDRQGNEGVDPQVPPAAPTNLRVAR